MLIGAFLLARMLHAILEKALSVALQFRSVLVFTEQSYKYLLVVLIVKYNQRHLTGMQTKQAR